MEGMKMSELEINKFLASCIFNLPHGVGIIYVILI